MMKIIKRILFGIILLLVIISVCDLVATHLHVRKLRAEKERRKQLYEGAFTVNVKAVDWESAAYVTTMQVLTDSQDNSGLVPLQGLTLEYVAKPHRHEWVDNKERRIYVTAEGHATNEYMVRGETNINALLLSLD